VQGQESPEDKVYNLAGELLEKIPEQLNLEEVAERWKRDEGPLKTVLLQEISRYNILLAVVKQSLIDLR
jgi:hypothetical protein